MFVPAVLLHCALTLLHVVPPVPGPVIERFHAPTCDRCAGRRGVTIASTSGSDVRAVANGVVTFSGSVARHKYVVAQISPGVLVTYGWLAEVSVLKNDVLAEGQVLGRAGSRTYLGVRIRGRYVEPLGYLGLGGARLVGRGVLSR